MVSVHFAHSGAAAWIAAHRLASGLGPKHVAISTSISSVQAVLPVFGLGPTHVASNPSGSGCPQLGGGGGLVPLQEK